MFSLNDLTSPTPYLLALLIQLGLISAVVRPLWVGMALNSSFE
uniref:Uncharacterized protein n=1 Tax=Utricularia reniformis TaxID=192314 RepID=A0A1Y0B4X8_9LAMI|nr:hypothetical protein AEK19_MT2294 [Utricularia reniformis]ART32439.1 hypothetical protein AEK19_MT2294 [Utricularia reniformis]